MRATLLGLMSIGAVAFAQEENNYQHCFDTKFFYRQHDEENYKYEIMGLGCDYHLNRPEGLNLKLSFITNLKEKNALVEAESSLFYKIPVKDFHTLYPIFSVRMASHQINHKLTSDTYIHKSSGYIGFGWEAINEEGLGFRLEAQGFRDIQNVLIQQSDERFTGHKYSNPFGARATLGITKSWENRYHLDLCGFYGHTFTKCYKEMGLEMAFKWGF